jgi:predicted enzyme related to lactoylglutathione lyase
MITGLGGATIWSEDINNLLPFYKDTLGMKTGQQRETESGAPDFVVLSQGNEPALALGTHSEVKGKASDPYRHMVGLNSDDLEGDYQRLSGAGVEFIEKPTDYGGLKIATLKDPDGNVVQLFQFTG